MIISDGKYAINAKFITEMVKNGKRKITVIFKREECERQKIVTLEFQGTDERDAMFAKYESFDG